MGKLEGKVAIITGGASGIGLGAVRVFLKEGATVAIVDKSRNLGPVFQKLRMTYPNNIQAYQGDIRDAKRMKEVVADVVRTFGKIDILVNNAGVANYKPFLEITDEERDWVIDINVKGAWNMCQAAIPYMLKQGGGAIVNTSSVTGPLVADSGSSSYALSKGALLSFTKAMAIEYAKNNIRINAIQPGLIRTPLITDSMDGATGEEGIRQMAAAIPMKRVGDPLEAGELIAFLASDEASYITGQGVVIDGGSTIPETNNVLGGVE